MNAPKWLLPAALLAVLATTAILIWRPRKGGGETPKQLTPDAGNSIPPHDKQKGIPPDVLAALDGATSWVLLSLQPGPYREAPDKFHDYPVLGRVPLEDPKVAVSTIRDLVKAGEAWNGMVAMCFDPRHGLSAVLKDGRRIEFVICYACSQADLYVDGTQVNGVLFADSTFTPDPGTLNGLLRSHNIPLSGRN
jgi:hypothetical protein